MNLEICRSVTKSVLYRAPRTIRIAAYNTVKTNAKGIEKKQHRKYFTKSVTPLDILLGRNLFISLDLIEVMVVVSNMTDYGLRILIIFLVVALKITVCIHNFSQAT